MNNTKRKVRGFIMALCLLFPAVMQAQVLTGSFPAESLAERITRIAKSSGQNIAFDENKVKNIRVPALEATGISVEQALGSSLSATRFTYRKKTDNSFVVYERRAEEKNPEPGKEKGKGSLSGTVLDEKGEPIPGATVMVAGTTMGTATDIDGKYKLANIPAGTVTIRISFISYETLQVNDVKITANRTTPLDAALKEAAQELGEVVVTAEYNKASTMVLLARQRENVTITDGISAEQMKLTADNNVAQVLKRVSGVTMQENRLVVVRGMSDRYNNVQLNGASLPSSEPNRRNFSLDVLPSNLVDNVVVAKTFIPDMSGEFSGGTVQVSTLSVPDEPFLSVSAGSGFNTQSTDKDFWSNARYKQDYFLGADKRHWLKDGWVDRYRAATGQEKIDLAAEMPNHWGLQQFTGMPTQTYSLSGGLPVRFGSNSSLGLIAALTYRHEESREDYEYKAPFTPAKAEDGIKNTFVTTATGLFNAGWKSKNHRIDFRNIYNYRFTHENSRQTDVDEVDYYLKLVSSVRENTLWQTRLEGEHRLWNNRLTATWFADYNELERYQPDDRYNRAMVAGQNTEGELPYTWFTSRPGERVAYDAGGMYASLLRESKKNIGGNLEYGYTVAGNKQKIKAGYWGAFRTADFNQATMTLRTSTGTPADGMYRPVQDEFGPGNFRNGIYQFEFTSFSPGGGVGNGDRYKGTQDIHAAYLMADLAFFKKLHLTGGVRMEETEMGVDTWARITINGGRHWIDTLIVYRKTDWLPSITATWDFTERLKFRASYSKTLARADFRERSATEYYDPWERAVISGNGGIRDAISANYDLRLEWYPSPGEIISVSAFYKDFTDPVEMVATGNSNGQKNFFLNLNTAMAKGLELNLRKHFGFFAVALKDLYLSGNLTLMDGSVRLEPMDIEGNEIGSETRDRLPNALSPIVWNAGLAYDGAVLGAAVNYNYVGHRVRFAGTDRFRDQYDAGRGALDAQLNCRLLKGKMEIRLNASDLLAKLYIQYRNARTLVGTDEVGHGIFEYADGGDHGYNEDVDEVLRKSRRGTTYSCSISYKF